MGRFLFENSMTFDIITIFPKIFDSYFNESILARAQKKGLIKIKIHNLRAWSYDRHKKVDDRPYGGGPGMILKAEPICKALSALKSKARNQKSRTIMLTPAGKTFNHHMAERLSKFDRLILLCGRYEGFDRRCEKFVDEKISIGDYVLSGGELPAVVVLEAVARQIPGVVGHVHALDEETFAKKDYIEYPQYTRPRKLKVKGQRSKVIELSVPKVLLSGDHKKILEWRRKHAKKK